MLDVDYLQRALAVAIGVLEELTKEHAEFSHINPSRMKEIIRAFWRFEKEGLTTKVIEADLLRFILKEELLVFARRNGGTITHKECYQVVMKNITNPAESKQETVNVRIEKGVDVNIKESWPIRISGDVTTRSY